MNIIVTTPAAILLVQMANMTASLLGIRARSIPVPCTQMFAMSAIQVAPSAEWLWSPSSEHFIVFYVWFIYLYLFNIYICVYSLCINLCMLSFIYLFTI